jgi:uncharacterized protein YprB with RNaseH-like and TPR domain
MSAEFSQNDDFREKMKALGIRVGVKDLKPAGRVQNYRIEDVINAREESTPFGPALVFEEVYPLEYLHGNQRLSALGDYQVIADWAEIPAAKQENPQRLLFLDTETTGLSNATGTFAFLIGLGFLRDDGFHLCQIIMRAPPQEAALLAIFNRLAADFDTMVTYNGKSFDIPLLVSRHILHRIPPPFGSLGHIDLLHLARKLWRNRLPSRRLGDLEQSILNFKRTQEEVPGWLVPEIYKDYLRSGDARPLAGVFYHNAADVLSLAGLFAYTARMLAAPLDNEINDIDLAAIGTVFEELGSWDKAKDIYHLSIDGELSGELSVRTRRRLAKLYKREQRWEQAASVWELMTDDDIEACIELAKYHEHVRRSPAEAMQWTQKALELYTAHRANWVEQDINELQNRMNRLMRKLASANEGGKI